MSLIIYEILFIGLLAGGGALIHPPSHSFNSSLQSFALKESINAKFSQTTTNASKQYCKSNSGIRI